MINKQQLWYLATPYSKYENKDDAFKQAALWAGDLIKQGIIVVSPIVHTHPIAKFSGLDPVDADLWFNVDLPLLKKCDGVIVPIMEGWDESVGVKIEIAMFRACSRPVWYVYRTGNKELRFVERM